MGTVWGTDREVYYPSLLAHIRLRFDESTQRLPAPVILSDGRMEPEPSTSKSRGLPLFVEGANDDLSRVINLVPLSASVQLPGFRQASTFNLTLDYADLPVDPWVVRAASVVIHLGTVSADLWARGQDGERAPDGRLLSMLDPYTAAGTPNPETLVMVGIVDEWSVTHSDAGSEISMSGRSLESILMDSPILPAQVSAVNLDQPIDAVVRNVLGFHPFGADIAAFVEVAPAERWPKGEIPRVAFEEVLPRPRRGRSGGAAENKGSGASNLSYWDLITRYCMLVGAVPYFAGQTLRIVPSRGLYDQATRAGVDPAVPTPFAGGVPRTLQGGKQLNIRRLTFGRDVATVTKHRKLGGVKARVVEVVSVDTGSSERGAQRLRKARWPVEDKASSVAPSGSSSQESVLRFPVPGIRSEERLREIARALFEEIMRGELGGDAETAHLSSLGGSNADPDLLRLRPGDAIQFTVDASGFGSTPPGVAALIREAGESFEAQVAALTKRFGDANTARLLVSALRGEVSQLQTVFYTQTVRIEWGGDGVRITFDFTNFIEATAT